jgi:hypothetical protein
VADIRYTTNVIDDFARTEEYPPGILPPWVHAPQWDLPGELDGQLKSPSFDPNNQAMSIWTGGVMTGPKAEVWGLSHQNADLHDGFYMGLLRESDGAGYYARWANNVGDDPVSITRLDGGGGGTLLNSTGNYLLGLGKTALMQIDGSTISVYVSTDGGANWTLLVDASDSTYRENLCGGLGMQGGAPRWISFGAGPFVRKSQIYRLIRN